MSGYLRNGLAYSAATSVVNGESRLVECWSGNGHVLIRVEDRDFRITPEGQNGDQLQRLADEAARGDQLDKEVLLGPVLVMALSMRGTWCLHASAVLRDGAAIVFLGDSGFGKSTLSAFLSRRLDDVERRDPAAAAGPSASLATTRERLENTNGWRLVADDILPVRLGSSDVNTWPHFPQLKIPPSEQPSIGLPEAIPLSAICVLKMMDPNSRPAVSLLTPTEGLQTLLRHTAGSRLFNPDLLALHLAFCAEAIKRVPFYELGYPHRRDALPIVKSCLSGLPTVAAGSQPPQIGAFS